MINKMLRKEIYEKYKKEYEKCFLEFKESVEKIEKILEENIITRKYDILIEKDYDFGKVRTILFRCCNLAIEYNNKSFELLRLDSHYSEINGFRFDKLGKSHFSKLTSLPPCYSLNDVENLVYLKCIKNKMRNDFHEKKLLLDTLNKKIQEEIWDEEIRIKRKEMKKKKKDEIQYINLD